MTFRRDIEGLRGLAILLVIFYHSGVPGFTGGYVGVDVFYVLSGYLITGLLLHEFTKTGTISFRQFYARRARRLLPAAALVLLVTLAVGPLFMAPEEQRRLASTAITTAAYASNFYFATQATEYFATDPEGNPLLHTWSLAVEEQFYLIWPVLLLIVLRRNRQRLPWALGSVAILSLAASIWLTHTSQPWAFFSSPTRAWEFALGALSYFVSRDLPRKPLLWGGFFAVVGSALTFDESTAFPGAIALWPVLGTCAMLIAGVRGRTGVLLHILESPPMQALGRLSYSWYLWHWPVLVFATLALGELAWSEALLLCGVALLLSQITYVLVESPIRRARLLVPRPAMTLIGAVFLTGGVLALSGWNRVSAVQALHSPEQQLFTLAYQDRPVVHTNGCHLPVSEVDGPKCVFGDPNAQTKIILFGDSHAAHWFPPFERLAVEQRWQLVTLTKSACPSADVILRRHNRRYIECERWRAKSLERMMKLKPTLVVLSNKTVRYLAEGVTAEHWYAGMRSTLRRLSGEGVRTLVLEDTPRPGFVAPSCLARAARTPWEEELACSFPKSRREDILARQLTRRATRGIAGASTADLSALICGIGDACETMRNGQILYMDENHLTASFAESLAPEILPVLRMPLKGLSISRRYDGAIKANRESAPVPQGAEVWSGGVPD